MSKNIFDGIGGSIVFSEGGRRMTKDGKPWEAPDTLIVSFRGNKMYLNIDTLKFVVKMLQENPDLENMVR
jgi:hypothetical protein